MIIGTAGHIDHGKTALVRALTGVDADRLPEEKRRGMTVDLGFAYRAIPAPGEAAGERMLGFVDVPGHERFIHNMLAGATGIDFVLLVVAADDGPMPQTREHLEIVSLLGIERGVVALTKIDRVSRERRVKAASEVRDLLGGSALRNAEIMPVSSVTGEGVAALAAHLASAAEAADAREPRGEFRLAVDRSFVLPGIGVVVTGTVAAGSIAVGERAVLTPSGVAVRIRGIHAHNRPARIGRAGERCALHLSGAPAERERVRRGDWVVAPSLHMPTDRLDAALRLLRPDRKILREGGAVHLHLGAARVGARLARLADNPLPGGETPAQLVLEHEIGAWRGDRFILRDAAARHTIGGAVVLDPYPPSRGRRRPERLAALAALARPRPAAALAELLRQSSAGVDLDRFALAGGLTPAEANAVWREAGAHLVKVEQQRHGFAFSPERFAALRRDIVVALSAHHRATPDSPGLEFERLRLGLPERPPPAVLRAIVKALAEEGAVGMRGGAIHLPGHKAALPPAEVRLWLRICRRFDERGFDPPWVRDLAAELALPETAMRQLMKRLAHIGELVEVAPDRFYRRRTVHQMAAMLAEMCNAAADGTVTAAGFRDRIGTGRKLAIIILEFFDRTGLTSRRGDLRTIRPERLQIFAQPHRDPRPTASR
jgi:selenocysteine-specific elongation factor